MNLKAILKEHGYEIVTHIGMRFLRIKFTEEELERRQKIIPYMTMILLVCMM